MSDRDPISELNLSADQTPNGSNGNHDTPEVAPETVAAPAFRMPDGPPDGTRARGSLAQGFEDAPPSADDAIDDALNTAIANVQAETTEPEIEIPAVETPAYETPTSEATENANEDWPENHYTYDWSPTTNETFEDAGAPLESSLEDDGAPLESDNPALNNSVTWDQSEVDPAWHEESATEHPIHATGDEWVPPSTPPGGIALAESNGEPEVPSPYDENAPHNDRELGLIEHLTELRTRLMWCVGSILVAMMVTWQITPQIEALMIQPVMTVMKRYGITGILQTLDPMEAFMIYFNTSLVSGIILVMPFLLFQMWRFIEPAMTKRERRFTGILVPFSSLLFFMGCALGYSVSPLFFQFFLQFQPPGTAANYSYASVAVLLVKMLLVFGVTFQVPIFTIFLNKSGMVERNTLIDYWRHVVVAIFVVVAVLTPTWDPVTMIVCALPPCLLYGGSIWLVKWL